MEHFKKSEDMADDKDVLKETNYCYNNPNGVPIEDNWLTKQDDEKQFNVYSFTRYKSSVISQFYIEEISKQYISNVTHFLNSSCNILKKDLENTIKTISADYKLYISKHLNKENKIFINEIVLAKKDLVIRIFHNNSYHKTKYALYYNIYSNSNEGLEEALELIQINFKEKINEEKSTGSINVLVGAGNALKLKSLEKRSKLNLDYYPESFKEVHLNIVKELKKKKGIILLHGIPGTGKTSYIKCIPNYIKNKKFIFIPPAFGDVLSSPEFLTFMLDNKNSVLIIEDAESVLRTREGGRNNAVSNILNITDGILSELLDIQVICTLNCKVNEIDEAIRRPGRLLLEHEFVKLSIEESTFLYTEIHKKDIEVTSEMTLAEIFAGKVSEKKRQLIGFQTCK